MNKKNIFSLSAFLTFLLNLIPVSAASFMGGQFFSQAGLFDAVHSILAVIFRTSLDTNLEAMVLFARIALFVLVFTLSFVLLRKIFTDTKSSWGSDEHHGNRSAIVVALIIGWASSVMLPIATLMSIFVLYLSLIVFILFGAVAAGAIYLNFVVLNETDPSKNPVLVSGTPINRITKTLTWFMVFLVMGSLAGELTDIANRGIADIQVGDSTSVFIMGFFSELFAWIGLFAASWNAIMLFFVMAGLVQVSFHTTINTIAGYQIKIKKDKQEIEKLAAELEDPAAKKIAQAVVQQVTAIEKSIEQASENLVEAKTPSQKIEASEVLQDTIKKATDKEKVLLAQIETMKEKIDAQMDRASGEESEKLKASLSVISSLEKTVKEMKIAHEKALKDAVKLSAALGEKSVEFRAAAKKLEGQSSRIYNIYLIKKDIINASAFKTPEMKEQALLGLKRSFLNNLIDELNEMMTEFDKILKLGKEILSDKDYKEIHDFFENCKIIQQNVNNTYLMCDDPKVTFAGLNKQWGKVNSGTWSDFNAFINKLGKE